MIADPKDLVGGLYDHFGWRVPGARVTLEIGRLTETHEYFHRQLDDTTSYGGLVATVAALAEARPDGPWAEMLADLRAMSDLVHEAFAVGMSLLTTQRRIEHLEGYPMYDRHVRVVQRLVGQGAHPWVALAALRAAATACMQRRNPTEAASGRQRCRGGAGDRRPSAGAGPAVASRGDPVDGVRRSVVRGGADGGRSLAHGGRRRRRPVRSRVGPPRRRADTSPARAAYERMLRYALGLEDDGLYFRPGGWRIDVAATAARVACASAILAVLFHLAGLEDVDREVVIATAGLVASMEVSPVRPGRRERRIAERLRGKGLDNTPLSAAQAYKALGKKQRREVSEEEVAEALEVLVDAGLADREDDEHWVLRAEGSEAWIRLRLTRGDRS